MKVKNVQVVLLLASLTAALFSCGSPDQKKMKYFKHGQELYKQGAYAKAGVEFKNAVRIDPKFAEGYYMQGMVAVRQQDWGRAQGRLSKAVELKPDLLDAQVELGKIYLISGRGEDAMQQADLVLAKNSNHLEALVLKAGCLLTDKKNVEAEAILRKVLKQAPQESDAYLMLARLKKKQGKETEAVTILKELLTHHERNQKGRLLLAEILGKDHPVAAEAQYNKLVALFPENLQLKILRVQFLVRSKKFQKAEKSFQDLIVENDQKSRYRLMLAQFYEARHQDDKMLGVLKKAIQDLPTQYGAYEMLANYYLSKEEDQRAVDFLNQFMRQVPTGPAYIHAKVFKAGIFFDEKKFDRALALLSQVLREDPDNIKAHTLKGDILANRGDFLGAVGEYRSVLNQEPDNIMIALKLARAHMRNHEPLLAEKMCKTIVNKDPSVVQAQLALADIYMRGGKTDLAAATLQKILETDPDNQYALLESARLKKKSGAVDRAIETLEKIIAKHPENNEASLFLASLYESRQEFRKAKQIYEQVLQKSPDKENPGIYYHLGMIDLKLGDTAKGKEMLQKALQSRRFFPGREAAEKALAES